MQTAKSRGTNFSLDSLDSKAPKILDRKKRNGRAPDIEEQLGQLQEELKKAKEDRNRTLEELEELKRNKDTPSSNLDKEVHVAKESERKMLESLISQTKQFEQTKISLEEANLEIRSLQESIKSLKSSNPFRAFRARDEIGMVEKELQLATAAEEKSKRAMDGLALALKEVASEAARAKAELERAKSEAQKFESLSKVSEEESKKLKLELEDRVATLTEKERVFMDCMKISEEENSKLIDSLRVSREDNAKLRDILKHSMNEATVMKETIEIARTENSRLQDLLSENEIALQSIRQDYDSLRVSEKAAVHSVNELKGFLDATSSCCIDEAKESEKVVELPSGRWGGESRKPNGRRHSLGGSRNLIGDGKNQVFGSVSNISDYRIPSSVYTCGSEGLKLEGESEGQKKKKTALRRFGDMLRRRRSFQKQ